MLSKRTGSIISLIAYVLIGAGIPAALAATDIVLLGPPNSGKGTFGAEITRIYGQPRISSGDIVRSEIAAGTDFGRAVKAVTESGGLIEDGSALAHELLSKLKRELSRPKYVNGAIFDGYPRTQWQAQELEKMLASMGRRINSAQQLVVPREVLLERAEGRLICNHCGISFHRTFKPPLQDMKCDKCCQLLTRRADDVREIAEKRIDIYEKESAALVSFYKDRGLLQELDGTTSIPDMLSKIQPTIDPKGVLRRDYLAGTISSYPGPKPDVPRMYNIVEIYENPDLFRSIAERMAELVSAMGVDYIAAPEARGWGLAGAVSFLTGKPLISIRKQGKLPRGADLAKVKYGTAYSEDAIELIRKPEYVGKRAVIIDDGNSTGGTALAARELLGQTGISAEGILTAIKYHYKKPLPEYLKWLDEGGVEASYYDLGL